MTNMSFRESDRAILKEFEDKKRIPQIKYLQVGDRQLRYMQLLSSQDRPLVVFVHGAPGSMTDYERYFQDSQLYERFNLLSVDRPGYGYSDFGKSEVSMKRQADLVQKVIDNISSHNNIILIGHSYGGPVVAKMAMDRPDSYKAVIMLAPAIDPDNEKTIALAGLPKNPIIRLLTPKALVVAADEKNTHVEELRKIEDGYSAISIPIYHIHGDKDSLVPFENLAYSEKMINNDVLVPVALSNVDHFLPWSHYDLVVETIIETAELP